MKVEQTPTDNRAGTTLKELAGWTEKLPDDESLAQEATFIKDLIEQWRQGRDKLDILRELEERYSLTYGKVSEMAGAVLVQATMWFSYEAEIDADDRTQIYEEARQAREKARLDEQRRKVELYLSQQGEE
jgi:hypothetical protein